MSDSWKLYNGIFYKKKTNIRNSITENQQHYDRSNFSLVNVNVIFNIIFFDYVKEWSCLCDIFFTYSGGWGGGRGVHSRGAFKQGGVY